MTKPQKDVVLIGLIVIAVMALIPPWERVMEGGHGSYGYWLVFYAPYSSASVALSRLVAQIILVVSACAAVYLYLRRDS